MQLGNIYGTSSFQRAALYKGDSLQEVQQELQQERSEHQLDQSKIDELERADLELKRVHADLMAHKELELRQRTLEFTQLSDKACFQAHTSH